MTSYQKQQVESYAKRITPSFIAIHREQSGWAAYHQGDCGNEVEQLFGTRDIPTAFTATAERSFVLSEIMRLNPGTCVVALS